MMEKMITLGRSRTEGRKDTLSWETNRPLRIFVEEFSSVYDEIRLQVIVLDPDPNYFYIKTHNTVVYFSRLKTPTLSVSISVTTSN